MAFEGCIDRDSAIKTIAKVRKLSAKKAEVWFAEKMLSGEISLANPNNGGYHYTVEEFAALVSAVK